MAFRLLQISDTHFGTEVGTVVQALQKRIAELEPNLVVLTGDITQRARRDEFIKAKVFLDSLGPVAKFCCPGNHDIPLFDLFTRFLNPYRTYTSILQLPLEIFYSSEDAELLMLNSTSRFRHVDGVLEMKYLKKHLEQFSSSNQKWKIVAFHHPMDCKQAVDQKNILRNSQEAMQALSGKGVDLVMGGHIHDPFTTTSVQKYPQLSKKMLISVCGTGVSSRTRRNAPNSFNLYDLDKNASSIIVKRFDFEADSALFKQISERTF
jgi:3',5'-cyclic AMP phosphodiesterase CpdA